MNGLFGGGNGTMFSPFLVEDVFDLDAVRNNLTAYYLQVVNIDLISISNWNPIRGFKGVFSGNKFTISNLAIDRGTEDNVGLFGDVRNPDIVALRNINLINANVTGANNTGALVGDAQCIIKKCNVSNSRINSIGVLKGNCGGIVGYLNTSTIKYCTVDNTTITTEGARAGGVVGRASYLKEASFCFAININVESTGSIGGSIGGVFGLLEGHVDGGIVKYCKSTGNVKGKNSIGGLAGGLDSYATGIKGAIRIEWCYSECSILGAENVGGLIGSANLYASSTAFRGVLNCYSAGNVEGAKYVAGVCGFSSSTEFNILKCYASGNTICNAILDYSFTSIIESGIVTGDGITSAYNIVLGNILNNTLINAVYNVGRVFPVSNVSILNYYLNTITVNNLTNADGNSTTTEQAKSKSFYEALGWSFEKKNEWKIQEGVNYPYLDLDIGWIGINEILEKKNGEWIEIEEVWEKKNGVWGDMSEVWEIQK